MIRALLPPIVLSLAACAAPTTRIPLQDAAPEAAGDISVGLDARVYPVGTIVGGQVTTKLSDHEVLTYSLTWNETDREDNGDQDDESGGGPGLGFGYRRYREAGHTGWMFGGRVDLFDLEIDWIEAPGLPGETRGQTDVIVLQPTIEGGYAWKLNDAWRFEAYAAFGAEINIDTSGRDVGEGGIGILGFSLRYGL